MFLSRDETTKLLKRFSIDGDVNYLRISNELGLHRSSYDYMKPSHKYLKNASVLKSIHGGFGHSKMGSEEFEKMPQTARVHQPMPIKQIPEAKTKPAVI